MDSTAATAAAVVAPMPSDGSSCEFWAPCVTVDSKHQRGYYGPKLIWFWWACILRRGRQSLHVGGLECTNRIEGQFPPTRMPE